ncbi:MAG: FAD-binding protein [Oribacterium sp.]|nr:FAD-binding protein [Oribacterium sp.]
MKRKIISTVLIAGMVMTGCAATETPEVATTALEQLPKAIVDAGTPFVDAVTGATITSDAIMEAVKGAITAAGGNPDSFSKDTGTNKSTEIKELEADVVVVGAGATGVSAALTAQQNGANVILLEKAADTMNLHLNTVKYRINQLEKTFGIDFTKMDAIYVSLAAAKIWIG